MQQWRLKVHLRRWIATYGLTPSTSSPSAKKTGKWSISSPAPPAKSRNNQRWPNRRRLFKSTAGYPLCVPKSSRLASALQATLLETISVPRISSKKVHNVPAVNVAYLKKWLQGPGRQSTTGRMPWYTLRKFAMIAWMKKWINHHLDWLEETANQPQGFGTEKMDWVHRAVPLNTPTCHGAHQG